MAWGKVMVRLIARRQSSFFAAVRAGKNWVSRGFYSLSVGLDMLSDRSYRSITLAGQGFEGRKSLKAKFFSLDDIAKLCGTGLSSKPGGYWKEVRVRLVTPDGSVYAGKTASICCFTPGLHSKEPKKFVLRADGQRFPITKIRGVYRASMRPAFLPSRRLWRGARRVQ